MIYCLSLLFFVTIVLHFISEFIVAFCLLIKFSVHPAFSRSFCLGNSVPLAQTPPSHPCLRSTYGCCPDGKTPAVGPGKRGCSGKTYYFDYTT